MLFMFGYKAKNKLSMHTKHTRWLTMIVCGHLKDWERRRKQKTDSYSVSNKLTVFQEVLSQASTLPQGKVCHPRSLCKGRCLLPHGWNKQLNSPLGSLVQCTLAHITIVTNILIFSHSPAIIRELKKKKKKKKKKDHMNLKMKCYTICPLNLKFIKSSLQCSDNNKYLYSAIRY